jgi:hypothetical protein
MNVVTLEELKRRIDVRRRALGLRGESYVPENSGVRRTPQKRALLAELEAGDVASGRKLYDSDFFEWTREQAGLLRRLQSERANTSLDLENLAEEIESLGKGDLRELTNEIARVIEHLLKLEHSPAVDPRRGWRESVMQHRFEAELILDDSPSFRRLLPERLPKAYRRARMKAGEGLTADALQIDGLPLECPYGLDEILSVDWFPTNRHGLA